MFSSKARYKIKGLPCVGGFHTGRLVRYSLILYLALEENAMGAILAQEGPEGVEHAVYYLSKKFLHYKEKYNLVEKTCLIMI